MNKIQNEHQVEITRKWINKFMEALVELDRRGQGEDHPLKYELEVNATKAMIKDLEGQIEVYYRNSSLTKDDKVKIAMNAPEIIEVVKFLIALKEDIQADNFVRSYYVVENRKYELSLREIKQ